LCPAFSVFNGELHPVGGKPADRVLNRHAFEVRIRGKRCAPTPLGNVAYVVMVILILIVIFLLDSAYVAPPRHHRSVVQIF
jgi:hypothetical protein